MLKKITALLAVFLMAGTALAAAMFFDDNPRYIQVGHDDTTESYVDMNSIQSIRYDPPYYIIKATVVTYDNFKAQTVKAQTLSTLLYDDKGLPTKQIILPDPAVNACDRYSVNGKAADNAFFTCYSMTFYHTFTKQPPSSTKRNE